jgi:hypothetical protein
MQWQVRVPSKLPCTRFFNTYVLFYYCNFISYCNVTHPNNFLFLSFRCLLYIFIVLWFMNEKYNLIFLNINFIFLKINLKKWYKIKYLMGAHHLYLSTQFKDLLIWSKTTSQVLLLKWFRNWFNQIKMMGKLTHDLNKFEWDLIKLIIIVFLII